jgi:hypothetical protein
MILIETYCLRFTDIFSVGRWRDIFKNTSYEDPRFSALKTAIPEYCFKSKADNTCKKYKYAFNSFCKCIQSWCFSFTPQVISLPATDSTIATYLIYLLEKFNSAAKIHEALYSINWAHSLGGFQNPCESYLVKSVKEGTLRSVSQAVKKKEPISPEVLICLVEKFGKETIILYRICDYAACV